MALSLMLRNTCKINGLRFLNTASLAPLRTCVTIRPALMLSKQLPQTNKLVPFGRNISLTAPRLTAAQPKGNHATLWTLERLVSLLLLGAIPTAFLAPSQVLDSILAASVVIHQHWGVEAIIADYMRPAVVGNIVPKVAHFGLIIVSIATLGGLFYFIYNDIGIVALTKKLWAIQPKEPKQEEEPAPPAKPGKK